jgi:hypothetical protein
MSVVRTEAGKAPSLAGGRGGRLLLAVTGMLSAVGDKEEIAWQRMW